MVGMLANIQPSSKNISSYPSGAAGPISQEYITIVQLKVHSFYMVQKSWKPTLAGSVL